MRFVPVLSVARPVRPPVLCPSRVPCRGWLFKRKSVGSCGDPSGVSAVVGIVCGGAPVLAIELAERVIRPAAVVDRFCPVQRR